MLSVQITPDLAGLRLDKCLCKKFDIAFGLAQKLIREKKVKVNGARVDAAYKTVEADHIEVFSDLKKRFETPKTKPRITAEKDKKFSASIIFEDENIVAINKPSGLATQGGSGIDISVDETFRPVIEQQGLVFDSSFPEAKVHIHYKSETECFKDYFSGKARLILVTRDLNAQEKEICKDSVYLISSSPSMDASKISSRICHLHLLCTFRVEKRGYEIFL